ncbi:MAG: PRC-barrel domain-containing protein [Bacteroidota bacterium]
MKRRLDELKGFSIETSDGKKGKIKDFLFDEDTWKVRYLDADFGSFFKDKRVLLPINALKEPLWDEELISVNLTSKQIENSPSPEDIPTISREYEKELMKHYGYAAYWSSGYIPPTHTGLYYPARPLNVPTKEVSEEKVSEERLATKLRSFKEVMGYHILATDGHLGHVEDLIADDADWQLIYLIIDTSNWRPWSKKVILLINWLDKISYETREVSIDVDTDTIKNAPEFDTGKPVDQAFEEALKEYYQRVFPSDEK